MTEEEIWKKIPGFKEYEISDKERWRNKTTRKISCSKDIKLHAGVVHIHLRDDDGKDKTLLFSRVVALAFHDNPDDLPCVLHINGNILDNTPGNLKWGRIADLGRTTQNKRRCTPILRLGNDGKVLEKYEDRDEMTKWIKKHTNVRTELDYVIRIRISGACNSEYDRAFGYRWKYEFNEIDGEEWKKHPDEKFDKYVFSTEGRCRLGKRLLLESEGRDGYMHLCLNTYRYRLHKLIAETFLDNPDDLPDVNHWNEIKTDNRVCNLVWSTKKDNAKHSNDKKVYQYTKDGKTFIKEFESVKAASEQTDTNKVSLGMCANGKYKSAGGFFWTYSKLA